MILYQKVEIREWGLGIDVHVYLRPYEGGLESPSPVQEKSCQELKRKWRFLCLTGWKFV